jgi:polyisoprenoid-binding protein YceI
MELPMRTVFRTTVAAFLLTATINAAADLSDVPSGEYSLDKSHGYIIYTYSHLGFSNPRISFDDFDVSLNLDSADPTNSNIDVVIDATSINTHVDEFNGHLNGENFFDTAKYPTITFTSTSIASTGDNTFDVTGDLTIRGITKSVVLATTINKAANHPMRDLPTIGVGATATVSRSDFGMTRGVPAIGDEVIIQIDVELPQKKDEG